MKIAELEPIELSKKQVLILGFSWIVAALMFGSFFLFGILGANADFTVDEDRTKDVGQMVQYPTGTYPTPYYPMEKIPFHVGTTGYLRQVKLGLHRYNNNPQIPTGKDFELRFYTYGGDLFYTSEPFLYGDLPDTSTYTDFVFDIPQNNSFYLTGGSDYFLVLSTTDGKGCLAGEDYHCGTTDLSTSNVSAYNVNCKFNDIADCSGSITKKPYLKTYFDYISEAPLQPPQLFSPALPYVSSSTPIRFTILNPEYGRVICVNTDNSWRQSSGVGIDNSYFTFAADVIDGVNSIKCHSEQGIRISDYLEFDLTFTPGTLAAPTPVFIETSNGFVYSYNPARVEVKGLLGGDIWCKRGSGSFFNAGSILEDQSVYFDLDFTDLGTLADGLEYTVSCYLETEEGNSSTVQQVYKYQSGSICSPDFGMALEDKGIILNTLATAYSVVANLPILGDLIFLDCVIYNDFYSNLVVVSTEDLTYHLNAFNVDEDVNIPLNGLKSSMTAWLTGTGYSAIKTTITTVLWIALMFGLFFKFIFPMVWTSTHPDQSGGLNKTISEVEDKLEEDMFK